MIAKKEDDKKKELGKITHLKVLHKSDFYQGRSKLDNWGG